MEEKLLYYVNQMFSGDSSGHDYHHTLRVYRSAMKIAENTPCSKEHVMLAALLHDVDDVKLFATENYANARSIMEKLELSPALVEEVIKSISAISFKGDGKSKPGSIEGQIVQDADRLDAIGAIGIARAFAFGGAKGRQMYEPDQAPQLNMTEAEYRSSKGHTINHFYEKLLLLKELMNTDAAKKLAEERHCFMETFLDEFYAEWNGER